MEASSTVGILFGATLAAAALSGLVGMGGGTLLVAVMASLLPPSQVVPLHGVVQLLSNSLRGLFLLRQVRWRLFFLYVPLQLVGVAVAIRLYRGETLEWFRPAIGIFVLAWLAWDRWRPKRLETPEAIFALAGFGGGLLTILVGVTGPYLSAFFLRRDLQKEEIVATKAAIQTVGHLSKIPAFLSVGFDYRAHAGLLLPLLAASVVGTWLGTRALRRVEARIFDRLFRITLGLLAMRLLASAIV